MSVENDIKHLQEEIKKIKARVDTLEQKSPQCPPPKEDPPNIIYKGRV